MGEALDESFLEAATLYTRVGCTKHAAISTTAADGAGPSTSSGDVMATLDSGAERILTYLPLRDMSPHQAVVIWGDGQESISTHYGDLDVEFYDHSSGSWVQVILGRVWYVPDSQHTLLSVRSLVESDCEVTFGPAGNSIQVSGLCFKVGSDSRIPMRLPGGARAAASSAKGKRPANPNGLPPGA